MRTTTIGYVYCMSCPMYTDCIQQVENKSQFPHCYMYAVFFNHPKRASPRIRCKHSIHRSGASDCRLLAIATETTLCFNQLGKGSIQANTFTRTNIAISRQNNHVGVSAETLASAKPSCQYSLYNCCGKIFRALASAGHNNTYN